MATSSNASCDNLLYGQESDPECHVKRWQNPTRSRRTLVVSILLVLSVVGNLYMIAVLDHADLLSKKSSPEQASEFHLYCM